MIKWACAVAFGFAVWALIYLFILLDDNEGKQ